MESGSVVFAVLDGDENPLTTSAAFSELQADIKDRLVRGTDPGRRHDDPLVPLSPGVSAGAGEERRTGTGARTSIGNLRRNITARFDAPAGPSFTGLANTREPDVEPGAIEPTQVVRGQTASSLTGIRR